MHHRLSAIIIKKNNKKIVEINSPNTTANKKIQRVQRVLPHLFHPGSAMHNGVLSQCVLPAHKSMEELRPKSITATVQYEITKTKKYIWFSQITCENTRKTEMMKSNNSGSIDHKHKDNSSLNVCI